MVGALEEEKENYKSRLGHFKGMQENNNNNNNNNGGRQTRSLIIENNGSMMEHDRIITRSHASASLHEPLQHLKIGSPLNRTENIKSRLPNGSPQPRERQHSDMELMKEKFAKLLLGEDMSGGGKGVSSALALSNAITNLAASVFGEQKRLEPMSAEVKTRWRKEIDWLLSVADHIVEFVPSKQRSKDGTNMEIMVTRQRNDLHMNIPALRKLDAMLMDYSQKEKTIRKDNKWWKPTPKVPPNGLSDVTRKWLQFQKDSVNQVLKAAMAINAQVLAEMQIPDSYIESLPKNGRASLGDLIYKSITDDYFDPDLLLCSLDLSSEHKILDLKDKIEASVVIWKRKMHAKDSKSSWSSAVSLEKREIFEDRAETILIILKHRFPGIPQSTLEISKIQYNKDVGQALLESYSRIIESLAFTVLSRIEDVMHADSLAQDPPGADKKRNPLTEPSPKKFTNAKEEVEKLNSAETPSSMTLSDFMGWNNSDHVETTDTKKDMQLGKTPSIITNKKLSYIER
ncbi:hypothetical protein ACJIZ3_020394 [Penstemon smallii]|uniref:PRONE domain-containing protein n=1 Tax=Penstemon smallii TaxID=265156 RepID=A0ABD3SJ27_9LAMI